MEISKALQEEILTVQNKLKNAIRDHQICVGKLKDDPNNPEILGQIQQIQLHIVSLGRCQKQVVQRLRKEVEAFKAENAANGVKVSIASLLGFNNNNHITNNNEKKIKEEKENDVVPNGLDCRPTKEDYEDEVVRNGDDCPSPQEDIKIKERSSSVETVSYEDEIVEISTEERTPEKKPDVKEISLECASKAQLAFLNVLELITTSKYSELQSKRAERKRRSTANPQFVYSSLELPTKRKRYSYLQSAGNAPQTRQTTARLNGPSPPLAGNASGKVSSVSSKSSTSPPAKNLTSKSLIATQKSTIRPNILRNAMESKVYSDISKSRNETNNQIPSAKSVQNVGNKAVHIPGLPSSLTIERVESDAAVCIRCRKPGHLSICENCTTNFHVSCYPGSTENPSSKLCPKCSSSTSKTKEQDDLLSCKKEEEDIEEKIKERYELRERNSDLRLQVYELEKRSQLLSQSLQLQQRTRQELLGKQEKTQKSIKRLVDFIKLMQQRNEATSSPQHSTSTSCRLRRSSSPSPQRTCTPATQVSVTSTATSGSKTIIEANTSSKRSHSGSKNSDTSATSPTSATISPTSQPITAKSQSIIARNSNNHISLYKKCEAEGESQKSRALPTSNSSNSNTSSSSNGCPKNPDAKAAISLSENRQFLLQPATQQSDVVLINNNNNNNNNSLQIESSYQKNHQVQHHQRNERSTEGKPEFYVSHENTGSKISEKKDTEIHTLDETGVLTKKRITSQGSIGRNLVYSTHCSQAITSPISSPMIINNRKSIMSENAKIKAITNPTETEIMLQSQKNT